MSPLHDHVLPDPSDPLARYVGPPEAADDADAEPEHLPDLAVVRAADLRIMSAGDAAEAVARWRKHRPRDAEVYDGVRVTEAGVVPLGDEGVEP